MTGSTESRPVISDTKADWSKNIAKESALFSTCRPPIKLGRGERIETIGKSGAPPDPIPRPNCIHPNNICYFDNNVHLRLANGYPSSGCRLIKHVFTNLLMLGFDSTKVAGLGQHTKIAIRKYVRPIGQIQIRQTKSTWIA